MKKWIFSSIIYLVLVIGAYTAYSIFTTDEKADEHENHETEETTDDLGHEEDKDDHGDHDGHEDNSEATASEVETKVELAADTITVTLKDKEGNPVDNLEVNHEKLMHLILIGEDLETFKHLHPEKEEPGKFIVEAELEDGMYQAFVDIKPAGLDYTVEPQTIMAGEHADHGEEEAHLHPESEWTKKVDQYEVTLDVEGTTVEDSIVLNFNIQGGEPENYLGALGHVVVVDEKLEQFIHVHPQSGDTPVFEAHFTKPGMYKLWAEFKLDGEVYAFPYVLEITE